MERERTIRAHTKSRAGCLVCKRRRVKCDEIQPSCGPCDRYGARCAWKPRKTRRVVVSESPPPLYTPLSAPLPMDIPSMRLMYHWGVGVSYSIATAPINIPLLQHHIPQLSFSRPFLLHSMLSLSAFHLSQLYPEITEYSYSSAAHRRSALSLLPSLNTGGSDQSILGVAFLTLSTMSSGFNSSQQHNLIGMLTTIHNIFHGKNYFVSCDQSFLGIDFNRFMDQNPGDNNDEPRNPFPIHLLCIHLPTSPFPDPDELSEPEIADAYKSAVDALQIAHLFIQLGFESFGAVSWPERFSPQFCGMLKERRPRALVILYHYCVMLNGMSSSCWWARESWRHVEWIRGMLDERWRTCLDIDPGASITPLDFE